MQKARANTVKGIVARTVHSWPATTVCTESLQYSRAFQSYSPNRSANSSRALASGPVATARQNKFRGPEAAGLRQARWWGPKKHRCAWLRIGFHPIALKYVSEIQVYRYLRRSARCGRVGTEAAEGGGGWAEVGVAVVPVISIGARGMNGMGVTIRGRGNGHTADGRRKRLACFQWCRIPAIELCVPFCPP